MDTTTVNFPGGKHIYQHYGAHSVYGSATLNGKRLWKVGLLTKRETYDGSSLVHREVYTWDAPYKISNEKYVRPPYDGEDSAHGFYYDDYTWAPVLLRKDITRDGATYTTTYSNFDASYNPQTVTETGEDSRTTSLTYFPRNTSQNIVRLVEDENVSGASYASTTRTFDSSGNPTRVTRRGIQDDFGYTSAGDVSSRTNGRSQHWTYTGYYRGIPQTENWPAGVSISRNVAGDGTITSERDGRGNTTTYTYDGLNRVTGINPPRGSSTSVNWSSTGRTVTRGGYTQSVTFDGFGRPSNINTDGVTQDLDYNALGHKTFESYPGSGSGTSYSVDVLGRVTRMSHPDGTARSIDYSTNRVIVSNERGNTTTYAYRSFGDPDRIEDRALTNITAPESGSVSISINKVGNPTSVSQGGVTRSFNYDSSNCLTSETNPETGTTIYGRDAVCNMTSRRVGSSGTTTFSYDGLDRLTSINYPGSTPSVTLDYDGNSNLTLMNNGVGNRSYSYDANNNLTSERLTIDGRTFEASYVFDTIDFVSSLTYPSGRVVTFAPNDLGRPTQVSPFVTSVTHHDNGIPASIRYANGVSTTIGLDSRQWINRMDGTSNTPSLSYGYDGAGNVTGITNSLDTADSKSLSYDGLDRLVRAGTATMSYDAAGNLRSLNTALGNLSLNYSSNRLSSISGYRSGSFGYDSYGNVTGDGRFTFGYDDASNLRTVSGAGAATYDYDGNGNRVRSTRNGAVTHHFYERNGNLLGDYRADGTITTEYAYLGSRLVATAVESLDTDADGVPDAFDNCPAHANADQADRDGDGIGDACEAPFVMGFGKVNGPFIRVCGYYFTPDAAVYIGDQLASTQYINDGSIIIYPPPGASGALWVSNASGDGMAPRSFPLTGVSVGCADPRDGQKVNRLVGVLGSGFLKDPSVDVMIGDILAPSMQVASDSQLFFLMPPGAVTAPITVTVGSESASLAVDYPVLP